MNFFDPRWTSENQPYAPKRFRDIVKERYLISLHTHTGYNETSSISPTERILLLQCINEDLQNKKDLYEKMKSQQNISR